MEQIVKIVDTREYPSIDPARMGKFDVIITYQTDAFHTYLVTLPKDGLSEEKIKEAIKKEMTEREKWIGKDIKIT